MKREKEENSMYGNRVSKFLESGENGALNQERTRFAWDKSKQIKMGVIRNVSGNLGLGKSVKDLECCAEDQDFALWVVDDH